MFKFLLLLLIAGNVWGESRPTIFDFEHGTDGWKTEGRFQGEAYCGPYTTDIFMPSKLGGDYWSGLDFPVGQEGKCLLTSVRKKSDTAAGSLASADFTIEPDQQYVSFRIGGANDMMHERVELQVLVSGDRDGALLPLIHSWWLSAPEMALPNDAKLRDGDYLTVGAATGRDSAMLRQVSAEIPAFLRGMRARFKIVDGPSGGQISADYLRVAKDAPGAMHEPVWGFGDYHTHPMSYMALGGLRGIQTLWGEPGGNVDDYNDPDRITRDIPHCVWGHNGGYFAEAFIKGSQIEHHDAGSVIMAILAPHRRSGGPEFQNFPDHLLGAHEQMHITGIRRSYDGGLRLMVALAVDNKAAQFLAGIVRNGHMDLVGEKNPWKNSLPP